MNEAAISGSSDHPITSFNENEPIVNTPTEALNCFLRTKMHRIVLENFEVARKGE